MKIYASICALVLALIAYGGLLLPALISAKSTEAVISGVVSAPVVGAIVFYCGRYIFRALVKHFNAKEK